MGAVIVVLVAAVAMALDALGMVGVLGRFAETAFVVVPGIFMLSLAYGLPIRRRD
ncbi:MAG: hypothetical protein HY508_02850 [Acidobacteria bacterium]|nr:hypothetical protein [Acidobacteriota bacterium]